MFICHPTNVMQLMRNILITHAHLVLMTKVMMPLASNLNILFGVNKAVFFNLFLMIVCFFALFPALVGAFVLLHIFRVQRTPADKSNRINKIRLVWFALTREDLFIAVFPWLENDELENVTRNKG